jgi:beta-galactosidase/beta-glucuronidase
MTVTNDGNASTPVEVKFYEPNSTDVKFVTKGMPNTELKFRVPDVDLWSPSSPTLYNMTVSMGSDVVQSYTGFRTIEKDTSSGVARPLLNGEFIFQMGTLDQGFWPDGIYTPPSLEAMEFDLITLKNLGYNMLRKHVWVQTPLQCHFTDYITDQGGNCTLLSTL